MYVYVGTEKHDNPVYATAVAAVRHRIEEFYIHDGDDELVDRAEQIVASSDERAAQRLLDERSSYEYEGIDRVEVIE